MLRSAQGWSQEVLADLSGLNRSYVGAVERMEHNIGLDNIEKIAAAFNVSVADLVSNGQPPQATKLPDKDHSILQQAPSAPESPLPDSAITINRKTFMQLLEYCKDNQQEPVFNYLQFRGIRVID